MGKALVAATIPVFHLQVEECESQKREHYDLYDFGIP